jgi:hypothetical protein
MPINDQVVLVAGPGPVDRRSSGVSPSLSARTQHTTAKPHNEPRSEIMG